MTKFCYFFYTGSISWKEDGEMMTHLRQEHDSVVLNDRLYILGGTKAKRSMEVLGKEGWTEDRQLPLAEWRGCSVAISPFEVIIIQGTVEETKSKNIFKYDTRTKEFKQYKTANGQLESVSHLRQFTIL